MQNRRDQVQAHTFVVGRLVSGLLRAEPDSHFTPLRRFVVGSVAGAFLGAVVVAGFGVFGLFFPGGAKAWSEPKTLVVEKETGARYVFVGGELRPVVNYTSARLVLGGEPKIARVSRKSIGGVPHGMPIGIEGAPDYLPDLKRLDGRHWQVCSTPRPDVNSVGRPLVTLWVGARPAGRSLGTDEALLVRDPGGALYLAWNGRRWKVPDAATLNALGYSAAPQRPVGWAWINALPAGNDLVAPDVPDRGRNGPVVDGRPTLVGQVLKASAVASGAGDSQYYLVRPDGLSPLTATGAALLLANPETRKAYSGATVEALPVSPATIASMRQSRSSSVNSQMPASAPKLAEVNNDQAPCLQLAMDAGSGVSVRVAVGSEPSAASAKAPTSAGLAGAVGDPRLADLVVVEPGTGLLIRDQPAPGVADGALHLLVDCGMQYPLPSEEVAKTLGYEQVSPTPVPGAVLALLPAGQPLDPLAARATAWAPAGPSAPASNQVSRPT
jgi:type VII secretion protein EccB